jgi:L-seryl-tRNA(Ser) seleniumtransferase
VIVPPVANRTPTLTIAWDNGKVKVTKEEFMERLRKGNPSIEVMGGKDNSIVITSWNMQSGQEKIVASRIKEELGKASG